jgi:hypothetical protein
LAYVYYFSFIDFYIQVAERARDENYNPILNENFPNTIRLNDKSQLDHVATDDNDVFAWIKDQAKKGVESSHVSLLSVTF